MDFSGMSLIKLRKEEMESQVREESTPSSFGFTAPRWLSCFQLPVLSVEGLSKSFEWQEE